MDFNNLLKRLAAISETQVREDDVEENAFNQAAADAAKHHKKEFEFPKGSGKMHPVKMDKGTAHKISETDDDADDADDADDKKPTNESQDLEECYGQAMMGGGEPEQESGMNINASTDTRTGHKSLTVTAQGQAAEQLAQILKLSGMNPQTAQHDAEMEEAYANEPAPETQGIDVQIAQGNDLNRPKNSYPKVAGGDNPMAMREARELAAIEQRLNEELAAFKVMAEGKGKPDFLDMDKDGDRKEPMKKALADKSKKKEVSEAVVAEKAVSQQQQKFMGMVHAMQKGAKVKGASPELKKAAKGMSKKAAKDYASTKHKGLPKKVKESIELTEADLQSLIKKFGMAAVTAAALAGLGGTAQAQTTPSYQAKPAAVQQAVSPEYQAKLDKKFNDMYASNPAFKEEVKNLPSLAGYHNVRSPFSLHVHKASNSDKINLLKKFKALPESVSESRTTLQEADLQSLIKKFGMAAVTAAALAGLGGTAQARPNIDDPGSYKVPVPISAPAQQQQSSELQDLAQYGVKAVKDLGNDFTQVRFQDRDGVFDGHSNQIYFYSSKTDGLEKVKIKDGRMTTDYTSASDIGPMTRAAFQKAGIPILQGGGINIGNKSPADGAVRPYFASQSQPGSPKPKSATIQ